MPHFFDSTLRPAHWMNRYGVVFIPRELEPDTCWGRSFPEVPTTKPEVRDAVKEEAYQRGYRFDYKADQWSKP